MGRPSLRLIRAAAHFHVMGRQATVAKAYFEKLCQLVEELEIEKQVGVELKAKHFFSGAALYANNATCASWTPPNFTLTLAFPRS